MIKVKRKSKHSSKDNFSFSISIFLACIQESTVNKRISQHKYYRISPGYNVIHILVLTLTDSHGCHTCRVVAGNEGFSLTLDLLSLLYRPPSPGRDPPLRKRLCRSSFCYLAVYTLYNTAVYSLLTCILQRRISNNGH